MGITKKFMVIIGALALIGGSVAFAIFQSAQNDEAESTNQEDSSTSSPASEAAEGAISSKLPDDTEEQNPPAATVEITSLDQDSNTVYVRTLVGGATSGTCTATFEKSGQSSVSKSAAVQFVPPRYYACGNIDVTKPEFTTGGEWSLRVSLSYDAGTVTSGAKTIDISL